MRTVTFSVLGTPVPQGSLSGFVVGKRLWDGSVMNARAVVTASNRHKLNPWRTDVKAAAEAACAGIDVRDEAVRVTLRFVLARPSSVKRAWPATRPDLDKLARAVLDALTGVAFTDDSRVVELACSKRYATNNDDPPGVHVVVAPATKDGGTVNAGA